MNTNRNSDSKKNLSRIPPDGCCGRVYHGVLNRNESLNGVFQFVLHKIKL